MGGYTMEPLVNPTSLMETAATIAVGAAELITRQRAEIVSLDEVTTTKSSDVDPVTIVDKSAEDYIADQLAQLRPEDGLLGEEGGNRSSKSGVTWIVDPIDGTVNFLYGIPQYAVSIAAEYGGEIIAGAVVNVQTGELFHAAHDEGAWLQQAGQKQRLRVTSKSELHTALVATGFGYDASRRAVQASLLGNILPHIRDIRRFGSAALDLCAVAAGRVDAYYEHGLNAWDFAAGLLIAQEAGAKVWAPSPSMPGSAGEIIVVAAPEVAEEMYALLQSIGALKSLAH